MITKKKTCRFLKNCPCWDQSSDGTEWCYVGDCYGSDPIGGSWERCPRPKKRDKKIAQIAKRKAANIKKRNGLKCWNCNDVLDDVMFTVLVPTPGPGDDCSTKAKICNTCFVNYSWVVAEKK